MRKRVAGALIRLAHRIYRPRVTEISPQMRVMLAEKQLADARAALARDLRAFEQINTSFNLSYPVKCLDDKTAAALVERAMRRRDLSIQHGAGC